MDCCRHGGPREQGYIRCLVKLFFKTLVLVGCFSANTPAAATEVPALGGYIATGATGTTAPYDTENEAIQNARWIALGCFHDPYPYRGVTVCYDPYEIVEAPPWNFDSVNFWLWWRIVYVRMPVRRYPDAGGYDIQYLYEYMRIQLLYRCPSGYRFVEDGSTYQIGSPRPTCTDGLPACPVAALTPIATDNTCAQTLEAYNSTQAQRTAACGTLTPPMQTAVGCFQNKLATVNNPATGQPIPLVVTADIRNIEYQRHFREIWDKMERLVALTEDNPTLATACATRRAEVAAEKGCNHAGGCRPRPPHNECRITGGRNHCLVSPPAPPDPNAAAHTQGRAIDVDETQTVNALEDALAARTPPQTIQGFLDAPTNCSLDWLGNADRVHFQLR